MASNIVFQSVMMFMAFFYTDIYGISAAAVGTLFLVVRIIDAVTDPIMGAIADRTNTRWGKFRPYLLLLCVPFAITLILAFTTPNLSATGKLIYAYITYSLMMLVYTAINIPYCALGGVITADPQERVSLNSYRFFLSTGAGVIIAATALKLVDYFGKGEKAVGFQYSMIFFSILAIILFIACFFLTKERIVQVSSQKPSFIKDLKYLFKNDQWLIVSLMTFVLLVPSVIRAGAAIYYMEHYLGKQNLVTAFLTTGMVSSMLGASLASIITKKVSKIKLFMILHILVAVISAAMYFLGNQQVIMIFVFFGLVQFLSVITSPILWAMTADTVDYGEWKTGRRTTGLVFSGMLFALKMGMAVGGALMGWILAYYGYIGTAPEQTPEAVHGIVLTFTIVPAIGHFLLALLVTRYKLTTKRFYEIRKELDQNPAVKS